MSANQKISLQRRLVDAIIMFMVSAVSIGLLIYVGYGEASRTYERFQIERLIAQGELVQDNLENYLRPGLPIRDFAGFNNLGDSILTSDPTVVSISVIDMADQPVFEDGPPLILAKPDARASSEYSHEIRRTGDSTQALLPLRNRFETVGKLVLTMNGAEIRNHVIAKFEPLWIAGFIASIAFAMFTFVVETRSRGTALHKVGFAISFMGVAAMLIYTLVALYTTGVEARARSILSALGGRLDDVADLGIDYKDIDGLSDLLVDFKRLNPDMDRVAITIDGVNIAHTSDTRIGHRWVTDENTREISHFLSAETAEHPVVLRAQILLSGIYWQVGRAIKNFAALFLASALFAGFFMELARVLQHRVVARLTSDDPVSAEPRAVMEMNANALVKPAFFLAVFMDSLIYPFLPQVTLEAARQASVTGSYASLPFMLYYLFFAAALVPAGRFERVTGSRWLIVVGLLLSGFSYAGLAFDASFVTLMLSRGLAGIGQGLLFIGVQTFVLSNTPFNKRTQAAGVIVFGFQAGSLAGMAIGSLLYSQIGMVGICELAAIVACLTCVYSFAILPAHEGEHRVVAPPSKQGVFRDLLMMLRDSQFLRSMALVGVPAKSIMTGVIFFTLPLLLSKHGYPNEDIGQITMCYAAAVLWASNIVSRHADRNGGIKHILVLGALLSGAGLLAVAAGGRLSDPEWSVATIVAGVVLVGVAHGFINAPVVIHVSDAAVSTKLGAGNVAATYRLLERAGHVFGPGLMGQALVVFGQDWSTVYWIAGAVAVLAILFAVSDRSKASPALGTEFSV